MTKLEQSMLTDFYDKRYEKDAYNLTCISDDESSHIRNMLYSIQKRKLSTNAEKNNYTYRLWVWGWSTAPIIRRDCARSAG